MRSVSALLLSTLLVPAVLPDAHAENVVFPPGAMRQNGGAVIDVTKAPYFADPTGRRDSTAALVHAYADVMNQKYYVLYLPNGTYRVTNTIVYPGPISRCRPGCNGEYNTNIRFQGENREHTIIKLVNHAPGFGPGASKPVVAFGRTGQSNAVASNFFENITIDTGKGNPGAVGLWAHGSNNQAVRNVTIRSEDGAGAVGLLIPEDDAQGLLKNISIEGFDYAIECARVAATALSFEHIRIHSQKKAGVWVQQSAVAMRDLRSRNRVPALLMTGEQGDMVLVDSHLTGEAKNTRAIERRAGYLFLDNVNIVGYRDSRTIGESSSDPPVSLFRRERPAMLHLPVEETPHVPWESDFRQWVSVNHFGASPGGKIDSTAAIRKAMASGKSTIYFEPGEYLINGSIDIPGTVRRVIFFYARFRAGPYLKTHKIGVFRSVGTSAQPLVLEKMFSWGGGAGLQHWIEQASRRPLVLKDLHAQRAAMYANSVTGGKVWLENVSDNVVTCESNAESCPAFDFRGQKVWARFLNPEKGFPEILNDGSRFWLLGYKTEGLGSIFVTKDGGQTEILGGSSHCYTQPKVIPDSSAVIVNDASSVSYVGASDERRSDTSLHNYWRVIVRETQGGITKTLTNAQVPLRGGKPTQYIVPLYSGRPAAQP